LQLVNGITTCCGQYSLCYTTTEAFNDGCFGTEHDGCDQCAISKVILVFFFVVIVQIICGLQNIHLYGNVVFIKSNLIVLFLFYDFTLLLLCRCSRVNETRSKVT
jgi:hypothetical protein